MKYVLLIGALVATAFTVQAAETAHQSGHISKYAGQEQRAIKSLSPEDIAELRNGSGWGLAKAAELNGVPGPAHLLELSDRIPLSAAQVAEISKVRDEMQARAIELGLSLIALEQELEQHFQNRTITEPVLRSSLTQIASVRNDLRYTHLSTHLLMPGILSEAQVTKYQALRGYGNSGH